ncbi:hypothetical protein TREMEDRAFT_11544, partial [Tremella mesenterica DSM 1558]|uniref:uncharacterized protein n=1 Tax=Tremella mesenterica (strain ATCC 24925 / CBS 8224 / DSM 1558 / NBRC 9311 / NRRL Y-6157 / RJB 2259-6 / UBC 559-6) TaxID=578456 RepID=UPI0003F4A28C
MSRPPPHPSSSYPQGHNRLPSFPQLLHHSHQQSSSSHPQSSHSSYPSLTRSDPHARIREPTPDDLQEDEEYDGNKRSSGVKMEAGPSGSGSTERKHATRKRVVQSCSECRRRKIKCDKKFPCGPCILRGDQSKCREVGMAEKNITAASPFATTTDLAHVSHRLDALEASLVKTGALIPADLEYFSRESHVGVSAAEKRITDEDSEDQDDTEDAALTLEHLAWGRSRVEGSHSIAHFGTHPNSASTKAPNNDYHFSTFSRPPVNYHLPSPHFRSTGPSPTAHRNSIGERSNSRTSGMIGMTEDEKFRRIEELVQLIGLMDPLELFWSKTTVGLRWIVDRLPSPDRGKLLITNYLQKVDWLFRCIHVPTFLKQCSDLWAVPRDRISEEISLPFIALYICACSLGLQFMDPEEIAENFTPEEAHSVPSQYYNCIRASMYGSDFGGQPTVEHCQTFVLMCALMNNRDRSEIAWSFLGAHIKMAQSLGMSRLGAEEPANDEKGSPMWTGRWESLIQREVGRRTWWNLVYLDWSQAPSYHNQSCVTPDQIRTALPANIDDEDLIDGLPLRAKPLNVRTTMSFQLAKFKFAEIAHRQISQEMNMPHVPYSFVYMTDAPVDGELRKAMMELPAFFQPDRDRRPPLPHDPKNLVQYYEKIMLSLAVHSRMLQLHRPWLSRGYKDERFAYSKEQCLRAARASVRMMLQDDGVASFLEKWWIPLFYVSVADMLIIIDLLRTNKKHMHSKDTDAKIAELKVRRIAHVSHPARAVVKVMDTLMAEVEERRKPTSTLGKRKSPSAEAGNEEEPNLQHAVKKLILQAALEQDS